MLRTSWVAPVEIGLSGPRDVVEAGFRDGTGALMAEADLWARRDPRTSTVEFSFSGKDKVDVPLNASDVLPPTRDSEDPA